MSTLEDRYAICPQMRVYDQLTPALAPYVAFISKPHFKSDIVNIDSNGFRVSYAGTRAVDTTAWRNITKKAIILGGSFTFGVGATHDRSTLASRMNSITPFTFINLGIRAGNSTQELIASIPFVAHSECILVCSGINNLVVNLQSHGKHDLFGPLFYEENYNLFFNYSITEIAEMIRSQRTSLNPRKTIEEMARKVHRVLFQKIKSTRGTARHQSLLTSDAEPEVRTKFRQAIEIQKRDLNLLVKLLPSKSRLIFAAQPFASTSKQILSLQEVELFKIMDSLQLWHWQIIKTHLKKLWPEYVAELESFCRTQNISFIDLNQIDFDGWCFVDRIHMTDNGYTQIANAIARELV
jgi:hypothetical protein